MYYNRNDRKVLLWLLATIVMCCVAFFLFDRYDTQNIAESMNDSLEIDSTEEYGKGYSRYYTDKNRYARRRTEYQQQLNDDLKELEALDDIQTGRAELFSFDPNTASAKDLLRLGLKPWQVRSLLKYRTHGGTFRNPEDFGKLYGLSAKQYKTLLPYIKIDREQFMPASEIVEKDPFEPVYVSRDTFPKQKKIRVGETVDIATADSTALKTVPGIGSYFARRIIRYRNELGGYVSVDQLNEISDFPLDSKKFLIVKSVAVKKIDINKATLVQMKRHPYMGFFRAKSIIDHRREHGQIHSINELSYSKYFPADAIQRLLPYISAE